LEKVFEIRGLLNQLRKHGQLREIPIPSISLYSEITPTDIFLQTQLIIAELNLLKLALNIQATTNREKPFVDKTPSNVFYQMQHIEYMLNRLLITRNN